MKKEITLKRVILRRQQVEAKTGLSRSSIYKFMSTGDFPKSILLGTRTVGWVESEIDDWLDKRVRSVRGAVA